MKSIIQKNKECFVCGLQKNLESHHCIHGVANRKLAEKYGLKVWLCKAHHTEVHDHSTYLDEFLKRTAQKKFEEQFGTREDFMRIFGKNYIIERKKHESNDVSVRQMSESVCTGEEFNIICEE